MEITLRQGSRVKKVEAVNNRTLLQIIRENDFSVANPCGGNGKCGKCVVYLENAGNVKSCTYTPAEDITVTLPGREESLVLTKQYKLTWKPADEIPGNHPNSESYLGLAIDIGTTTIAFYLINLHTLEIIQTAGIENPQSRYGADVISRILYAGSNKGLNALHKVIIDGINEKILELCTISGYKPSQLGRITFTGNTTMIHLLLHIDPSPLGMAPYKPTYEGWKEMSLPSLSLYGIPSGKAIVVPHVSGFVGGDILAGLASLDPPQSIKNYLFIDIGTNGEMALVEENRILTCSTAAGPAFEGANIQCGMTATNGAVNTFESPENYTTIGGKAAHGICGSGLIDLVAYLLRAGILSRDGTLKENFHITKNVFITQQDIRELQLAKAAISAGMETLLQIAGRSLDEIDAMYMAGGFGYFINIENAIEIGLLPDKMKSRITVVGNTSGTGALLLLKYGAFKNRIDSILNKTTYTELSGNDNFVVSFAMNMEF